VRETTADQDRILEEPRRATFARVFVDRGSSDWVDLTALEGRNWLQTWSHVIHVDQPVQQLDFTVSQRQGGLSLSPLNADSKLNASGVLLDLNNAVRFETAVLPPNTQPEESDWEEVFRGGIDKVDWNKSPIRVRCRGLGRTPQDRWVETQFDVPAATATDDIEDVVQEILDNVFGASVIDLYSVNGTGGTPWNPADSPGFVINKYSQQRQSVQQATQVLANMIGWDLRYRWQANRAAFELVMSDAVRPVRARGTLSLTGLPTATETFVVNLTTITAVASSPGADEFEIGATAAETAANIVTTLNLDSESDNIIAYRDGNNVVIEWREPGTDGNAVTFTESLTNATADGGGVLGGTRSGTAISTIKTIGDDQYFEPTMLALSISNIRNVVEVTYGRTQDERTTIVVKDDTSITKYGRRFMSVAEDAGSQVDTAGEALDFGNAILDALKEPEADFELPMLYFWPAELQDFYRLTANGEHFSSDTNVAVVGIRHTGTQSQARTSIVARSKPAAGFARYLDMEARQGLAPGVDDAGLAAPTGFQVGEAVGALVYEIDDPREMVPPIHDWALTELYVSDTGGFTPGPANLAARGKETRFDIDGLVPGDTYYARARLIDFAGNKGTFTSQISAQTEKVGPFHENNEREFGSGLNPNPNFGVQTKDITTIPPDWWGIKLNANWGTSDGNFYFDNAVQLSGDTSLKFQDEVNQVVGARYREFGSDLVLIEEDQLLALYFAWQHDGTSGNNTAWAPELAFFDKAKASLGPPWDQVLPRDMLSTYSPDIATVFTPNTWILDRGWATPPANARYVKVFIRLNSGSIMAAAQTSFPNVFWDHFRLNRSIVKLTVNPVTGIDRAIATATWVRPYLAVASSAIIDNANAWTPGDNFPVIVEHVYTVPFSKWYRVMGKGRTTTFPTGRDLQAKVTKNGADLQVGSSVRSAGATFAGYAYVISEPVFLTKGDTLQLWLKHNQGGGLTIDDSECEFKVIEDTSQST
jgi:hypothetical protein